MITILTLLGLLQLSFMSTTISMAVPVEVDLTTAELNNHSTSSPVSLQPRELPCTAPESPNPCKQSDAFPCGVVNPDAESKAKLEQEDLFDFVESARRRFNECKDTRKCQGPDVKKFVADFLRTTYSAELSKGEMECNVDLKCTVCCSYIVFR